MRIETACPCCGRELQQDTALRWDGGVGALTLRGMCVRLSPTRARMFDALWRARGKRVISPSQMMSHVYAEDPNGGPESPNVISVHMNNLKKIIAPFGLTISVYKGYSLLDLPAESVAA